MKVKVVAFTQLQTATKVQPAETTTANDSTYANLAANAAKSTVPNSTSAYSRVHPSHWHHPTSFRPPLTRSSSASVAPIASSGTRAGGLKLLGRSAAIKACPRPSLFQAMLCRCSGPSKAPKETRPSTDHSYSIFEITGALVLLASIAQGGSKVTARAAVKHACSPYVARGELKAECHALC